MVILFEIDVFYYGLILKYKILYIFYGLLNNYIIYVCNINIECYVIEKGFVVVMFVVDYSFYFNMVYGCDFFEFVSMELLYVMKNWFLFLDKKEDIFIVGYFMGGYGVFKVVFIFLEKF